MSNQTLLLFALAVVVAVLVMQKPTQPGVLVVVDDAAAEKERTALQRALASKPVVQQAGMVGQKYAVLPEVSRVGTRWVVK